MSWSAERQRPVLNRLFLYLLHLKLTEAMDVLHRQVDEYENEIRALKDFKSPKSARRTSMSSRASPFMSPGFSAKGTPAGEPLAEASAATIGALEAALLRPALEAVRQDASRCKAQSMATALSSLPPLNLVTPTSTNKKESKEQIQQLETLANALSEARSHVRMQKASVTVVDLSKSDKSPRQTLLESMAKTYSAEMKLADAVFATNQWLDDRQGIVAGKPSTADAPLLGKVKIPGDGSLSVPLTMNKTALTRLHNCLVR